MSNLHMIDFLDVAFEICQESDNWFKNFKLEELTGDKIKEDKYKNHDLEQARGQLEKTREDMGKQFGDILKILGVGMFRADFQIKAPKNVKYAVPEEEVQFLKDLLKRYRESRVWKKILKEKHDKIPYDILGRYKNLSISEKMEVTEELKVTILGLIRVYTKIQRYKLNNAECELSEQQMLERRKEFMTCIYRENSFPALVVLEPSFKKYEELLFWGLGKKTGTVLDYRFETDLTMVFVDLANEMTEILDKCSERIHLIFEKRKLEYAFMEIMEAMPIIKELDKKLSINSDKSVVLQEDNLNARNRYQNRAKMEVLKEQILKKFREELKDYDTKAKDDLIDLLTGAMTLEEIEEWNPVTNFEENEFFREIAEITTIDKILETVKKHEKKHKTVNDIVLCFF